MSGETENFRQKILKIKLKNEETNGIIASIEEKQQRKD